MVNDTGTEVIAGLAVKEVPQGNYMMRFGDFGADPITLSIEGSSGDNDKGEWIRDERTGLRMPPNKREKSFNLFFAEKIPQGSIVDFGEGNKFLVVAAATEALQKQYPDSVFAVRIAFEDRVDEDGKLREGYHTLQERYYDEGKVDMIYSLDLGNVPLTDTTKEKFVKKPQ